MSVLSSDESAPECFVPAVINAGHALEKSTPQCNDIQPTGRSVCAHVHSHARAVYHKLFITDHGEKSSPKQMSKQTHFYLLFMSSINCCCRALNGFHLL